MSKRLLLAIASASLAMPILVFLAVGAFMAATGELTRSSNDFLPPLVLLFLAPVLVLPLSIAVAGVLAFLTRWCMQQGYASFGRMTLIGAALGVLSVFASFLTRFAQFPEGAFQPYPAEQILLIAAVVLGCAVGGAVTSAVYWLVLNPPSYYSHQPPPS